MNTRTEATVADLYHVLDEEGAEDISLAREIEEGADSAMVGRDEVFAVLEGER